MTDLAHLVDDYLATRRSLGFKLTATGRTLASMLEYLERTGAETLTVAHALEFARSGPPARARTQALRLSAVRGFARWATLIEPTVEVPPDRLLPARESRAAPFIYTADQITDLLQAADSLTPRLRAHTARTLIGLMAATGIRTGEACGLDIAHWDQQAGTLQVTGKYAKTRILPIHATVGDALTDYLRVRAAEQPAWDCPALLISTRGTRLSDISARILFNALTARTGLSRTSSACHPRLHDLRHTFAVNTMLDAYNGDGDPAQVLPLLSTWLGHSEPANTYWYLSATPELMAAATTRLQDHPGQPGQAQL